MISNKYTKVTIEEFNNIIFEDLTPEEKTQYLAHSLELALKDSGEEGINFDDVSISFDNDEHVKDVKIGFNVE